jgi:hypothetical protein
MTKLYPREDGREPRNYDPNPAGTRVFRVTDRNIHQRTRLIIAQYPEDAVSDKATEISALGGETIHEVVECVELVAHGLTWQSPPEPLS